MKSGVELIAEERERQISKEGWTPEHDDEYDDGALAQAAICYVEETLPDQDITAKWPWDKEWFKPSEDPTRNLVKAGALIAAEIDRLQRCKVG